MKANLVNSRLTDINIGRPLQVLRPDLFVHDSPRVELGLTPPRATTASVARRTGFVWLRETSPRGPSWERPGLLADNLFLVAGASAVSIGRAESKFGGLAEKCKR